MDFIAGLMQGPEAFLLIALPLGLIMLVVALISGGEERRQLARRITQMKFNHTKKVEAHQVLSARRAVQKSAIPGLDELVKRFIPQQDVLKLRIEQAGLEMSISGYVMLCVICGLIGFIGSNMVSFIPVSAALLIGVVAGLGVPHWYLGKLHARRQTRFIANFPEAIDLMVRGVRAGLPITESMKAAGEEIPDPVGAELKRITDGIRLGRKSDEVLWEASRRLDLQEFKFFTIALSIQGETGGNLAETLNNLSEVLRGRRQLKRKIKALSSEAKASAYIIGSLPFIMTLLIYLVNTEYIVGLFTDVRGQFMIGFGLFMIFAGAFVMRRMVKFEI